MKRKRVNGNNRFARFGLRSNSVTTMYHTYRGGVRR